MAGGFLALPLAAVALSFFTGVFTARYAVWGVLGIALSLALVSYLGTGRSLAFGRVAALYLLAVFAFLQVFELRRVSASTPRLSTRWSASPPQTYRSFMQIRWTTCRPPTMQLRTCPGGIYYLTDTEAALRRAGTDSPERALSLLAQMAPLHIEALRDFAAAHRRFFVLESGEFGWLVPELTERGVTLIVREASAETKLYEVSLDPAEIAVPTISAPRGRPSREQPGLQSR